MKVTINFGNELEAALQEHLDGGATVQQYIKAAVRFFKDLREQEQQGHIVGFGDKNRFEHYNTKVSPKTYLEYEQDI